MSLLVTIGLVLIGAVCLVVGFATNSLALIYVSIACSLLAAIVLVVFSRMSKRDTATGAAPAAGRSQQTWSPPSPPSPPAPASAGSWSPSETPSSFSAPPRQVDEPTARTPVWEPEPDVEPRAEPEPVASAATSTIGGVDDDFPIPRYDDLRVSQIQPLLGRLDLDDLDLVREHEELGKNRPTLLRMIDSRIDALERQAGAKAPPPTDAMDEDEDEDLADGDDDLLDLGDEPAPPAAQDEEPEPEEEFQAPFVAGPTAPADDGFPIADYDRRSVAEIIGMLDDLDNDELDMVAEREELGKNRAAILDAIDAMFDDEEQEAPPPPPPPPPPPVSRGPAKRGAAKVATIKASPVAKLPAKKAVPAKAPARKAAPVVKSPPTRSPAAKASADKAPAGKLPAAKIAAAKVAAAKAAPVKRAASARKTAPTAAAAPVKKAAGARKSAVAEPAPPAKKAAPRTPRGR